ncbi:catalysis At the Interface: the anatomy of A conformational change in A triglyceride lipase [Chlamydoabsidia padenii]|nr:catalysis At the Interface: the anatomy of A conformational change in A triglyceride lipase [Chlamydoabsidia padenii]
MIASPEQVSNIYLYMNLSFNAYCGSVVLGGQWSCPYCQSTVADDDVNGYILTSASLKTIFVVFRGSLSVQNLVNDLYLLKTNYPPGGTNAQVASGSYKSYQAVQHLVLNAMDKLLSQYPNYKIRLTGHSLGGVLAVLASLDLYQHFPQVTPLNTEIYTYGEFRIGNKQFAMYVLSTGIPNFRVVHGADRVPHTPSKTLGFIHSGLEYWIRDNETKLIEICPAEFESDECSNSLDSLDLLLNLSDHVSYTGHDILCS